MFTTIIRHEPVRSVINLVEVLHRIEEYVILLSGGSVGSLNELETMLGSLRNDVQLVYRSSTNSLLSGDSGFSEEDVAVILDAALRVLNTNGCFGSSVAHVELDSTHD